MFVFCLKITSSQVPRQKRQINNVKMEELSPTEARLVQANKQLRAQNQDLNTENDQL